MGDNAVLNKLLAIALIALLSTGCMQTTQDVPLKTRAQAIPENAQKMLPPTDGRPPVMHSNEWNQPLPIGAPINTAGAEDSPFITQDGNTLYFFFTPDVHVPVEKQAFDGVTGIWVATKNGSAWNEPTRVVLQESGKLALDGCEFVQRNRI
ncbi:hypothetical protein AUJ65_02850 [Candidatus Micrarchaeota archaeon CG1_02_51_15]|nr:MAG: hypothetical protein AUJ65_02850 [Candidatus Micrarchaeota archaeon CG1_02_51_15]